MVMVSWADVAKVKRRPLHRGTADRDSMSISSLLKQVNRAKALEMTLADGQRAPESTDGRQQAIGTFGGCASD